MFFFSPPVLPVSNVSSTDTGTAILHTGPPANQMLQDSKLANHGKQVTSDTRSQIPGVNPQAQQQGAAGHLGSKGVGAGSHGVKTNQISSGNPALKAASQSASGVGGMLKTKSKRERSVSMDSGDSRNAIPPALETDAKGGKACVAQKELCQRLGCIDSVFLF